MAAVGQIRRTARSQLGCKSLGSFFSCRWCSYEDGCACVCGLSFPAWFSWSGPTGHETTHHALPIRSPDVCTLRRVLRRCLLVYPVLIMLILTDIHILICIHIIYTPTELLADFTAAQFWEKLHLQLHPQLALPFRSPTRAFKSLCGFLFQFTWSSLIAR